MTECHSEGTRRDRVLCVAGDFNENLDGSKWYGLKESKKFINRSLDEAELECLTQMDMRKEKRLDTRASVDHICLSKNVDLLRLRHVHAWEGTVDGVKLSDHNGVLVELEIPDA